MTTTLLTKPSRPKTSRIERGTRLVERFLGQRLPSSSTLPQILHEAMRYCVFSGGKRFRPLLCLGACEATGAPARRALPIACAIELIHTYSLIHDDLPAMDNADERRGRPSCHRKFGEGTAVLTGDALLTLAFEWLTGNGNPHALAIVRAISQACGTTGLIGGQVLDLQRMSHSPATSERSLRDIAQRKTAALITASVVAGALAAGANPQQVRSLARYGQHLGLAFQIIDDVHDRDGLAQAMGVEQAQTDASRLITRALSALEPFGARAHLLRDLAGWLATST